MKNTSIHNQVRGFKKDVKNFIKNRRKIKM